MAAPYIARTLETVLPYLGVEPVYTEEEKSFIDKEIPDYTSLPVTVARAYAESRGLSVEVVGDGAYVGSQTPKSGSVYSLNGKIVFYTDGNEARSLTVPNVVGMSLSEANEVISESGFNALFKGATQSYAGAVVESQNPSAGESAPIGSVVTAEMRFVTAD